MPIAGYIGGAPAMNGFSSPGLRSPEGIANRIALGLWDPGIDADRANTVFLLQQAATETSVVDKSPSPKAITLSGTAQVNSAVAAGAAKVGGAGTISVASSSDFNLGGAGQKWRLDLLFQVASLSSGGALFNFGGGLCTSSVATNGNLTFDFPGASGSAGMGSGTVKVGWNLLTFAYDHTQGTWLCWSEGGYKIGNGSGASSTGAMGLVFGSSSLAPFFQYIRLTRSSIRGAVSGSPITRELGPLPAR